MNATTGLLLALALPAFCLPAAAQDREAEPLPRGDLFHPLLADPKQPRFFASFLWVDGPRLNTQVSAVGLGENIGLVRGRDGRWQLSVAAGVFSQFNLRTESNDLLNTDFIIGIPFSARWNGTSTRVRVYHQSSHLGDEFILNTRPERVNLSFESVELLVARELGNWRLYAGGEYIVRHEPADLDPGLFHAGLEYRHSGPLLRLGRLGSGRVIAALDAKSIGERKWQVGWSFRAGVEFGPARQGLILGRSWSVGVEAYDGPAPYGQFYRENVSVVGVGLHLTL
ncbi:MAG TPA: DUF1207 domain-containing protein [Gemmatimonadales bacterium]|nr:DUF1207 domain-containing protein [Gemmatimonadales bacterium]